MKTSATNQRRFQTILFISLLSILAISFVITYDSSEVKYEQEAFKRVHQQREVQVGEVKVDHQMCIENAAERQELSLAQQEKLCRRYLK